MRTFLIAIFVLILPTQGLALGAACYSPSDCTGMEHCTSLDDHIVPGRCTTDARIINDKPKVTIKPVLKASSSSSAKSSSSSSMSSSMSSSAPVDPTLDKSWMDSIISSFMSTMKSLASMMSSLGNSVKCMFGGCK